MRVERSQAATFGEFPLSLEYYEGPAGSGKTFQLIEALKAFVAEHPLRPDEAVLGVTYMHGSRRRMHSRLAKISVIKGRFVACTIDSLARSLVCRWRSLARIIDPDLNLSTSPDFETICRVAAHLMRKQCVSAWLKARYPLVVIDELQDCRGDRLSIVQILSSCCHVIAAADEFQDLSSSSQNPAVEWLQGSGGKRTILTGNHRTHDHVLLQAANSLRSSLDCGDILGYGAISARNAGVAAASIARTLHWKWKKPNSAVILTPTGPRKSDWVKNVLCRLSSKPIKPKGVPTEIGPYLLKWEANTEDAKAEADAKLGDISWGISLRDLETKCSGDSGIFRDLCTWAARKFHVRGQTEFSESDVGTALDRILQSRRSFLPTVSFGRVRAMTIHQAKNREFDGVIVLWPFTVGGNIESQRRLLYNALTRAQKWAIVVVQDNPDPNKSRLARPPFSKAPKS